jgi:hypothetical protein
MAVKKTDIIKWRFLMPGNQWVLVFFRIKKSISALPFITKVPIFAPNNTELG